MMTLGVSSDSIANYATLAANPTNVENGYGMTGLMFVTRVLESDPCYDTIAPGTIFLFPGISVETGVTPPPYIGTVSLACAPHAALITGPGQPTLHQQMCDLLDYPPTHFLGFSVTYPWDVRGNVSFNSGTCNVLWFGNRRVPDCGCDGINWQIQIMTALANGLGSP